MPRRYTSDKAADVREVLQGWASASGMKMHWNSKASLTTTGRVDEFDIHAAVITLAKQFRDDRASVVVSFNNRTLTVVDAIDQATGTPACRIIDSGSIVFGRHCTTAVEESSASKAASADSREALNPITTPTATATAATPLLPEKSAGTDATSAPKAQPQSPLKAAPALPLPPEPGQVLSISRGDYLSQALESWLKPRGYHLVWDVPARGDLVRDIEMTAPWSASTADLDTALSELLVPFGLRAIVQTKSRTIVVRAAAGSALQRSTPTAPAGATK